MECVGCLFFIANPEIIEDELEFVLCGEAGIHKVVVRSVPFLQAPVIKPLQFFVDNKGDNIVAQAFFKHDKTTYAPISVLKGMNAFEITMKSDDGFNRFVACSVIIAQKLLHFFCYVFGRTGRASAYFIREFFIITYAEPVFAAI